MGTATARDIIRHGLWAVRRVPFGQEPDAAVASYALSQLNDVLDHIAAFGAGRQAVNVRLLTSTEVPRQVTAARVLASGGISLTLPEEPHDGARLSVVDAQNDFATNPMTLKPNGLLIEGGTADLTLNTQGLKRSWMFRSDLADWVRVSDLTLDSAMPYPEEFNATFKLWVGERVGNSFGLRLGPDDQRMLEDGRAQLRTRYLPIVQPAPDLSSVAVGGTARSYGWLDPAIYPVFPAAAWSP